jgi:hypothetical protein
VPGIRGSAGWHNRKIKPEKHMNQFAISRHQIENSLLRSIGIIIYPGVEVIDIIGPTEVFMLENKALQM